jgi:hypothetical protein
MATLYLPAKKTWYGKLVVSKYNGKAHKERADEFYRYMPISVAYPAALFFYQVTNGLTTNIETYFINKAVDFFTELNVVEFLNMLAYYKDKERIRNLMMKNAKLRNG